MLSIKSVDVGFNGTFIDLPNGLSMNYNDVQNTPTFLPLMVKISTVQDVSTFNWLGRLKIGKHEKTGIIYLLSERNGYKNDYQYQGVINFNYKNHDNFVLMHKADYLYLKEMVNHIDLQDIISSSCSWLYQL